MRQYSVYNDFNTKLLEPDEIIEAKSGKDAVIKLLNKLGIKYTKLIRSGSNWIRFIARPLDSGKSSAYEIWNGDTCL